MKLELLYEFITLSRYLNFTVAARKLNISQASLSKHIAELEKEVGVPLVHHGRNVALTTAGNAFLEDAIKIDRAWKDSVRRAHDAASSDGEELVIQKPYIMDMTSEILLKSVMHYKAENSFATVRYYAESGKKSIELLSQEKIDIALTVGSEDSSWFDRIGEKKGIEFYPITREPLMVWLHAKHPLADKERISLIDLTRTTICMASNREYDPMRYALLDIFKKSTNLPPHFQIIQTNSLDEFFMNTNNITSVFIVTATLAKSPLLGIQHNMICRPIDSNRANLISYIAIRKNASNPGTHALLDHVRRVIVREIEHSPEIVFLDEIRKNIY